MTRAGVRIVLTRWSPLMALGVLAVTAILAVGPLFGLLDAQSLTEGIVMGVLTAVLAVPFLWTLWRVPKVVRGMGVDIDHDGVHPFDGKRTDTIAWTEIAGVGFGSYSRNYRGLKTKTLPALEIYLTNDDDAARHPRLRGDWQLVQPPADGYSAGCFRYTVSPYGKDAERIEAAVRLYRPQLWGGPFGHPRASDPHRHFG